MGKTQWKRVSLAELKNTKIGPIGYMVMFSACCFGYMIFLRPLVKERERLKFESQANILLKDQQLQDSGQLEQIDIKQ